MASTHDNILFFTNRGRVYRQKGFEIAEASRTARGLLSACSRWRKTKRSMR